MSYCRSTNIITLHFLQILKWISVWMSWSVLVCFFSKNGKKIYLIKEDTMITNVPFWWLCHILTSIPFIDDEYAIYWRLVFIILATNMPYIGDEYTIYWRRICHIVEFSISIDWIKELRTLCLIEGGQSVVGHWY